MDTNRPRLGPPSYMENSAINLHERLFLIELSFGFVTDSHSSSRSLKSPTKTYPIMLFSWSYMHNCNWQHYLMKLQCYCNRWSTFFQQLFAKY